MMLPLALTVARPPYADVFSSGDGRLDKILSWKAVVLFAAAAMANGKPILISTADLAVAASFSRLDLHNGRHSQELPGVLFHTQSAS